MLNSVEKYKGRRVLAHCILTGKEANTEIAILFNNYYYRIKYIVL